MDSLLKEFSFATPSNNENVINITNNISEISRSRSLTFNCQNQSTNSSALSFIQKHTASKILTCTALFDFKSQSSRQNFFKLKFYINN